MLQYFLYCCLSLFNSLSGNPLAEEKEIDGFIAAFLPNLVYYEFKMVDAKLRKSFTEKNQGEIFKVKKIIFV